MASAIYGPKGEWRCEHIADWIETIEKEHEQTVVRDPKNRTGRSTAEPGTGATVLGRAEESSSRITVILVPVLNDMAQASRTPSEGVNIHG